MKSKTADQKDLAVHSQLQPYVEKFVGERTSTREFFYTDVVQTLIVIDWLVSPFLLVVSLILRDMWWSTFCIVSLSKCFPTMRYWPVGPFITPVWVFYCPYRMIHRFLNSRREIRLAVEKRAENLSLLPGINAKSLAFQQISVEAALSTKEREIRYRIIETGEQIVRLKEIIAKGSLGKYQFTADVLGKLETQNLALFELLNQVQSSIKALNADREKLDEKLKDIRDFRDIISAANLVESNKQFIEFVNEALQDAKQLVNRSLAALENVTASSKALEMSVPEIGELYQTT